jgi:hypothetical protein
MPANDTLSEHGVSGRTWPTAWWMWFKLSRIPGPEITGYSGA